MTKLKLTAVGLALALSAGMASAADLSRGDTKFLQKAAESGMLEIQASQIAAQKAESAELKTFANMMVSDHTKVDQELKALASAKGVTLPTELSRGDRKTIDALNKKTGHAFDKEYANEIGKDAHKSAVKEFSSASKNAKDADVKAFAAKNLPALQAHLDKGTALDKATSSTRSHTSAASPMGPGTGANTAATPAAR